MNDHQGGETEYHGKYAQNAERTSPVPIVMERGIKVVEPVDSIFVRIAGVWGKYRMIVPKGSVDINSSKHFIFGNIAYVLKPTR